MDWRLILFNVTFVLESIGLLLIIVVAIKPKLLDRLFFGWWLLGFGILIKPLIYPAYKPDEFTMFLGFLNILLGCFFYVKILITNNRVKTGDEDFRDNE